MANKSDRHRSGLFTVTTIGDADGDGSDRRAANGNAASPAIRDASGTFLTDAVQALGRLLRMHANRPQVRVIEAEPAYPEIPWHQSLAALERAAVSHGHFWRLLSAS